MSKVLGGYTPVKLSKVKPAVKKTSKIEVAKPTGKWAEKRATITATVGQGWTKNPYKGMEVVVTSRTNLLKTIKGTAGRTFTSTHIGKDGKPHTIVGIKHTIQNDSFGYIRVYSLKDKQIRLINPQTVTAVMFRGVVYKARK